MPVHFLTRLCASLLLAMTAAAADYYVSTAGLDTNPGTLAQPWRTVQKAAGLVVAGDTVFIRGNGGVYTERVNVSGRDGTALAPIIFKTYPGDPTAAIETTIAVGESGNIALFSIVNSDYVTLENLEFRNCKTTGTNAQQKAKVPIGIYVGGNGAGIAIRNCKVHDIWQSCATANDFGANGFGILVYGDSATAIDGLILDANEIHTLRTGASESVVLNGNVTNFRVTGNTVRDCNNIGIDFIGFEGTNTNPALDQARFGVCSGNVVYNVDSKFNPAYGGNFMLGGGNSTRSAPGLYVDGGRDIVLERNHVYLCNFAVSVGSENTGKFVTNVTVRNNLLHHCHVGGIVTGGSSPTNGGANNCAFTNNTLYDNDTTGTGGGQFSIQENVSNITIQRNLMASTAGFAQFVLKTSTTGSIAAGAIDRNFYKGSVGGDIEFYWNNVAYTTFATWRAAAGLSKDANSTFTTGVIGLVNAAPTSASPAGDFAITRTSPLRDVGDTAGAPFTPAVGEKDFFGKNRVSNHRVDIGADELAFTFSTWALDTTGTALAFTTDTDGDGLLNGLEYATRTSASTANLSPFALTLPGNVAPRQFTFPFRSGVADLRYIVQRSSDLANVNGWLEIYRFDLANGAITETGVTADENAATQSITLTDPALGSRFFWRLKVEQVP